MAGSDAFALTSFVISIITFVFNMIWSPFEKARSSQIKLALDLKRKYTLEMQQHLDTMYSYQKKHRDASRYPEKDKDEEPHGYYTHWLSEMKPGLSADVEEKKVDNARRILGAYWAELFEYYDIGCLPAGSWIPHWVPRGPFWIPKNMLTGNFLRKAVKFMLLVEPIDIANWYRLKNNLEKNEEGRLKGDYSPEFRYRPNIYSHIEKHMPREERNAWHTQLLRIAKECRAEVGAQRPPLPVAGNV